MAQRAPSGTDLDRLLLLGANAVRAGKRESACALFRALCRNYPGERRAWIGLAAASADPAEQCVALRHLLWLEPANEVARAALTRLEARSAQLTPPAPQRQAVSVVRAVQSSADAHAQKDDGAGLAPASGTLATPADEHIAERSTTPTPSSALLVSDEQQESFAGAHESRIAAARAEPRALWPDPADEPWPMRARYSSKRADAERADVLGEGLGRGLGIVAVLLLVMSGLLVWWLTAPLERSSQASMPSATPALLSLPSTPLAVPAQSGQSSLPTQPVTPPFSAAQSEPLLEQPEPASVQVTTSTGQFLPQPAQFAPGEIREVDGWVVTLARPDFALALDGSLGALQPQGRFVLALLTLGNRGPLARSVPPTLFRLVDEQGRRYTPVPNASSAYLSLFGRGVRADRALEEPFEPGGSLFSVPVLFDVAPAVRGLVLHVGNEAGGWGISMP